MEVRPILTQKLFLFVFTLILYLAAWHFAPQVLASSMEPLTGDTLIDRDPSSQERIAPLLLPSRHSSFFQKALASMFSLVDPAGSLKPTSPRSREEDRHSSRQEEEDKPSFWELLCTRHSYSMRHYN